MEVEDAIALSSSRRLSGDSVLVSENRTEEAIGSLVNRGVPRRQRHSDDAIHQVESLSGDSEGAVVRVRIDEFVGRPPGPIQPQVVD